MGGVGELIGRARLRQPDAPALVAPGRAPLSYATLDELVSHTAEGLRQAGIGAESRVALIVENGPEAASAFLSIASTATAAPLNPAYRAQELAFYFDDLGAEAVVISESLDSPARDVARERGIRVIDLQVDRSDPAGVFTLREIGSGSAEPVVADEDVALLLHTSGTTSRPKLVPLTHAQLCLSARNVASTLELTAADRCLNVMPLFHIHGLVAALLASLEAGASVACTPGFHQIRFFDWLEELEPTWYTAVPTMHAAVLDRTRRDGGSVPGHGLRFIRSSSAALPRPVLEGLETEFGVPVVEAYGMTEAAHQMASNPLPPGTRKPGTVGPAAGPEIAILDQNGRLLGAGEVGEVAIRGANVFAGYEANPEANEAAFSDGWFRTGDEGSLDEDGFLTLRGRIKEIINRGGEKIAPVEIDEALLRHQAVKQAVTFGMADVRLGEQVAAAVVLAPGSDADERSLQDFVAAQLAPFKVPRRIVVLDEIPKGPTGKVQRIGLAERIGVHVNMTNQAARPPYFFLEPDLIAIWESVLEESGLDVSSDFFALGGDSLLGAEAVTRIRDLVGDPDLPLTAIVRAPTPAEMAREVFARVGAGCSGVVPLQASGTRTPLFLVHPGDGDVLAFSVLARRLGPDQPSYALRARGIDDGQAAPGSLAEMAAEYVDEIRRIQPHGPYLLGGFCLGGPIALEMADQLDKAGEEVGMLFLLDPRFPRPDGLRYKAWLAARRARQLRLAGAIGRKVARIVRESAVSPVDEAGKPDDLQIRLARLRESHRQRPSELATTVILSGEFENYELPTWYLRAIVRKPRRWTRLGGGHTKLLLPPTVDRVADEIRAALEPLSSR